MTIYFIKKRKGRKYTSEAIVPLLLEQEGIIGLHFCHGISGEPELIPESGTISTNPGPYRISISDTKSYWCAVIGQANSMGIDMEEKGRKVAPQLLRRLHPLEQQYLSGLTPGSREWEEEFLTIWTRKEAYSKFCGAGLSMGFGKFSVVDGDLNYGTSISCHLRPDAFVQNIELNSALTCSLCTENTERPVVIPFDYHGQPLVSPQTAAADILSVRNLSSAELKKKLMSKGFTPEEAQNTAEEMAAKGYTDDEAYATRQAALQARKGRSRQLIQRNLASKGLGQDDISAALDQLEEDGESELERASAVAEKLFPIPDRNKGEAPLEEKQLAKIGRKLASLGYGPSIIYKVLDRYRS